MDKQKIIVAIIFGCAVYCAERIGETRGRNYQYDLDKVSMDAKDNVIDMLNNKINTLDKNKKPRKKTSKVKKNEKEAK